VPPEASTLSPILVNVAVDALVAHRSVLLTMQVAIDLLAAPVQAQQALDLSLGSWGDTGLGALLTALQGHVVGLVGAVAALAPVTGKFARDGGLCTPMCSAIATWERPELSPIQK